MPLHGVDCLRNVRAVRVRVDQASTAACTAKQVVNRRVQRLALDIPQSHVNCPDGGHGYRAAPPVSTAIEILPDVFDGRWVSANQAWDDVVLQVADDG